MFQIGIVNLRNVLLFTVCLHLLNTANCHNPVNTDETQKKSAAARTREARYSRRVQADLQDKNWDTEEVLAGPPKQDDARIVAYAKSSLIPPSASPYRLKRQHWDPSIGQSSIVKRILKNKRDGFFVECGACDGVFESNTLDLERNYAWKGLLIEADPGLVDRMIRVNRKAWISPSCISPKPYPIQVPFGMKGAGGRILEELMNCNASTPAIFRGRNLFGLEGMRDNAKVEFEPRKIQCFPLFTLLLALGIDNVDYFSLDIEGLEFQVLQTIPFDRVSISILSVEYWPHKLTSQAERQMKAFMKQKGYDVITTLIHPNGIAADLMFVHQSLNVSRSDFKPITRFKYSRLMKEQKGYKKDWMHFKRK